MSSVKDAVKTFEAAGARKAPPELKRKPYHPVKDNVTKFQGYLNQVFEQREKKSPYQSLVHPGGVPPVFSFTNYLPPRDPPPGVPVLKWKPSATAS
jgi:hypothetical protein